MRDAGLPGLSLVSVLAGVVSAYGAFAIVAAIVAAALSGSGVETEFRTNDWSGSGAVAALASAVTLLIAYFFGGYVAGRMARRNAVLHGVMVFLLSLIAGAIAGAVVGLVGSNDDLKSNLRSIGVPTSSDQIKGVAIAGAVISIVAMLVGSIGGAMVGERWHTKLARRAADPEIGPEAEAHRAAEQERQARSERMNDDEAIRRDHETLRARDGDRDDDDRPGGARRPVRDDHSHVDATPSSPTGAVQQDQASDDGELRYTASQWREVEQARSNRDR